MLASDRVKKQSHESVVREKIMLICLIENPFLIAKYSEELGKIRFNDLNLSSLVSEILEFSASNVDKELENYDFLKIHEYLKENQTFRFKIFFYYKLNYCFKIFFNIIHYVFIRLIFFWTTNF